MLAERAPDSATADYLHEVFEPTARAITGLEPALEAVGLLDEAQTLDLRRPQDYFGRVWSTAFRTTDLTEPPEIEEVDAIRHPLPSPQRPRSPLAARRRQTRGEPTQLEKAITQLRRERRRLKCPSHRRASGSVRPFCYESTDARALAQAAVADARQRRDQGAQQEHECIEASWHERALNAEETLTGRRPSSPSSSGSAN